MVWQGEHVLRKPRVQYSEAMYPWRLESDWSSGDWLVGTRLSEGEVASTVLCPCGVLVRRRTHAVAAICFIAMGVVFSLSGYRHGEQYQAWLKQQPSSEELVRDLEGQLQFLGKTNAEPQHSADGSRPSRSGVNTTSAAAGSAR